MADNSTSTNDNLFASLISDIETYNGTDPILPWLRGISKMIDSLPSQLLKHKLPRFLQKCAQTFQTDIRYRNDLRYLRVWMKLLDFVDDPGAVLENMKGSHIGNKRLRYFELLSKLKIRLERNKRTLARRFYKEDVRSLAEPADELQKSFDRFLQRIERYKNKKIQRLERRSTRNQPVESLHLKEKNVISHHMENEKGNMGKSGENTVVVKFAQTAIVGKSKVEDACHHGLVEPTINTKEAMDAINSMFRDPLGPEPLQKYTSHKTKANDFIVSNDNNDSGSKVDPSSENQPVEEPFQIFCDDNEENMEEEKERSKAAFVFPSPIEIPLESSKDSESDRAPQARFKEDTVVFRFVGSTISDEPKVENVCHHGLVDPIVNLKEAMDDINSMFGKAIEFVRKRRPRKQENPFEEKQNCGSFLILQDDETDHHQQKTSTPSSSSSRKENDLFEQTVCTKEAMDDINKMFAMPLNF